jgi:hypothetical protein
MDAIVKFGQSIASDENRIETRKKLVDAYRAAGLEDMAKAQSEIIESMEPKKDVEGDGDGDGDRTESK